jgi:hypothetical protein
LSAIGFAPRLAQENLKSFLKLANMDGTRAHGPGPQFRTRLLSV